MGIFQDTQQTVGLGVGPAGTGASGVIYGDKFTLNHPYDQLIVLATIPALASSQLNVTIQESWDGGATWAEVCAFPSVANGGPTQMTREVVGRQMSGAGTFRTAGIGATPSMQLAAGTFCDGPWGNVLRLVAGTGASPSGSGVTVTVRFIPTQQSH